MSRATVLIQGASSGIGLEFVRQLLKRKTPTHVIATSQKMADDRLAQLQKENMKSAKNRLDVLELDVRHHDQFDTFAEQVQQSLDEVQHQRGLDLLINCAHICSFPFTLCTRTSMSFRASDQSSGDLVGQRFEYRPERSLSGERRRPVARDENSSRRAETRPVVVRLAFVFVGVAFVFVGVAVRLAHRQHLSGVGLDHQQQGGRMVRLPLVQVRVEHGDEEFGVGVRPSGAGGERHLRRKRRRETAAVRRHVSGRRQHPDDSRVQETLSSRRSFSQ